MPIIQINYVAILVSAVVFMFLGYLWYGPFFGKLWMKLIGATQKDMDAAKAGMAKTYAISFIGALVTTYVLAHFVSVGQAASFGTGATIGFWAWLGFVATTGVNEFIYSPKPKPWKLYWLNQGYWLVSLLIAGGILAVWK